MSTDTIDPNLSMTLEEAVQEVLVLLTGQTLTYDSSYDRFRAVAQHLNRALRTNGLENEWSYYSDQLDLGTVAEGDQLFTLPNTQRYRIINDDAVRLVNTDGLPAVWGYFLPRDALHKYRNRKGLWVATTRTDLLLSRPINEWEEGYTLEVPVMREPAQFVIPVDPEEAVDPGVLSQPVDFPYPDLITARAAWMYAMADPVMQPRVQTLEELYTDMKYQAIERDTQYTESPYQNEIIVPVQNTIFGEDTRRPWPVANERAASE